MSKLICTSAIDGAIEWVLKAEGYVNRAIKEKGADQAIGFPDTNYYFCLLYTSPSPRDS